MELKRKTSSLSDTRQQLEQCEQEKTSLQANLVKLAQEGQAQQAELDRKAQGLARELQTAQQEKEAQGKELVAVKDGLAKASKAMKDSQSQLDKERKSSKAVLEEKVGLMWCSVVDLHVEGTDSNVKESGSYLGSYS